ncbi:MAG: DUF2283 domain-containing protein [Caldilineaceae bacterium SB0668_bin_21]|nr:DUF2283 domain-containing protein [Caldilineaceae bacterium SB0668_bin_21]MYC21869.1 DUF2283 domain-containing protein [Caldilineaceae bacterium SB0662_bin_25]
MDVRYFEDTDTLLVDFSDRKIVETRDAGEDLLIELDSDGKIVSLTVEHAGEHIDVLKLSYEWIPV